MKQAKEKAPECPCCNCPYYGVVSWNYEDKGCTYPDLICKKYLDYQAVLRDYNRGKER